MEENNTTPDIGDKVAHLEGIIKKIEEAAKANNWRDNSPLTFVEVSGFLGQKDNKFVLDLMKRGIIGSIKYGNDISLRRRSGSNRITIEQLIRYLRDCILEESEKMTEKIIIVNLLSHNQIFVDRVRSILNEINGRNSAVKYRIEVTRNKKIIYNPSISHALITNDTDGVQKAAELGKKVLFVLGLNEHGKKCIRMQTHLNGDALKNITYINYMEALQPESLGKILREFLGLEAGTPETSEDTSIPSETPLE